MFPPEASFNTHKERRKNNAVNEMETKYSSQDCTDEDFIDMEVTSFSSTRLLPSCSTDLSHQQAREFEFQMSCSISNDMNTNTSPADELFYKGKLLPLHQPPRFQMVQKLLQIPNEEEQTLNTPLLGKRMCSTAPCTNSHTPLDSCNISPSGSSRVSCELNPDEFHFEWSKDLSSFIDGNNIHHHPKRSNWSKKLRFIKDLSFGQKLKSSRAYLKSIFSKPACSDETGGVAEKGYIGNSRKYPTLANIMEVVDKEDNNNNEGLISHRRSFSRALKRHSPTKCLSSSSSGSSTTSFSASTSSSFSSSSSSSASTLSFNANRAFCDLQFLKRSGSDKTESETSIQAAIAHCKKSQHPVLSSSAQRYIVN